MSAMVKQTHHKHSSRKDYRRLLDPLKSSPDGRVGREPQVPPRA